MILFPKKQLIPAIRNPWKQRPYLSTTKSNRNVFACPPEEDSRGLGITELGYHFIGGALKHGPALCAAWAPTVNSYKRLVRRGLMSYYSWAPVFNSYGRNNRTNSLRVPMSGGRVESRNADSSCNPYLAATLALFAVGGQIASYFQQNPEARHEIDFDREEVTGNTVRLSLSSHERWSS